MKFLAIQRGTDADTSAAFITPEMMEALAKLGEETTSDGTVVFTGGLKPTSSGVRLHFSGKRRTVIDGPFTEAKEVVGGIAIYEVKSKEEAIALATRFAEITGVAEIELRPLYEPSDFSG